MSDHWSEHREGGGRFAIWLIRTIGLTFGRACARLLLYPITLYFFLRRTEERRASYEYLERVFGKPATMWMVMRHIHYFAATILDRIYLLTESLNRFDVNIVGLDEVHAQMRPDRGTLLLGAHVGSFEVLRVLSLRRPDVTVRVVLNTQQTPAMTDLLHALNPAIANNVIDASRPGHEVVFALHDAMQAGDLATLLGDRARPQEATVTVEFLGSPANFPVAPFLIASMLKVPMVMCLGLYRGGRRYELVFETLAEQINLPRRGREAELREFVQRYATRLEHHVRAHPYNWFNFYDFWNLETARDAEPVMPDPAVSGERG
ncbi:MAG TPA: acyltransferase [Dokdonella sp.]|uniref:LpxL/LpxP family acyltransferase n=1 Tax=Dokdonella sp. TaxID=2291710 RepID=UPI002D7EA856|nr:acyltransferase [Dokdonella sp.]HET9033279.1 acyltransferase [Dokdonella sp.]